MSAETSLQRLCKVKGVEVTSARQRHVEQLVESITDATPVQRKEIMRLAPKHPEFNDYLHSALSCLPLQEEKIQTAKALFDAVAVLRNKSAHAYSGFTGGDIEKLEIVGLAHLNSDGTPLLGPRLFLPIANLIVDFFKTCCKHLSHNEMSAVIFDGLK